MALSLSAIILGLINIAIVFAILLLIGAIIQWLLTWAGIAIPEMVHKLYLVIVCLIVIYMLVALLLGIPVVHLIHDGAS